MKQFLIALVFLLTNGITAQHTISGTFSPAEEFTYLLAYQLTPVGENYIADAPIKEGQFTMPLPQDASPGTYRMVYAIPQDEFYFDVIFNGEEDIELQFDLTKGVTFLNSKENKTFLSYFSAINLLEQQIVDFYNSERTDSVVFGKIIEKLKDTQETFEKESAQLISNEFIKANRGYLPEKFESKEKYILHKRQRYFDHLDFQNTNLQASGFLVDKAINYVFTALPTETVSAANTAEALKKNVDQVADRIKGLPVDYQFHLLHKIWQQTSANQLNEVSDYIFTTYLKGKAQNVKNLETIAAIEAKDRLRLGAIAPDIEWGDQTNVQKLSALEGWEHYVLVFWSSNCGHCLRELPALHKELKHLRNTKVIAVGLEEDETNWKLKSAELEGFEHVISLGKWESTYAKAYNIQKTPTYFVLDSEKRIVGKPEDDKALIELLKGKE